MLDFYADWCVSCKEMERFTFTDPVVAEKMSRALLLKADVTANNNDDRELLKRFRLFGPPGHDLLRRAGSRDRRRSRGRFSERRALRRHPEHRRPLTSNGALTVVEFRPLSRGGAAW